MPGHKCIQVRQLPSSSAHYLFSLPSPGSGGSLLVSEAVGEGALLGLRWPHQLSPLGHSSSSTSDLEKQVSLCPDPLALGASEHL